MSLPITLAPMRTHSVEFFMPYIFATPSTLDGCRDLQYDENYTVKSLYSALAIISMTCSVFVALTIFYTPKLRIHPSKLIGYMALCEALSCFNILIWAINPMEVICYFGLHYLFSWTQPFE